MGEGAALRAAQPGVQPGSKGTSLAFRSVTTSQLALSSPTKDLLGFLYKPSPAWRTGDAWLAQAGDAATLLHLLRLQRILGGDRQLMPEKEKPTQGGGKINEDLREGG